VLLLRRADQGDQNSNAWVFPGGLVEAGDRAWPVPPSGPPDLLPGGEGAGDDLAHRIAALRESFEEAGLLWALDARGAPLGFEADDPLWLGRRSALHRGEVALGDLCCAQGWQLQPDQLHPVAHWLTPPGMPKRFDTWFYLAAPPPGQQARLDGVELVEQRWVTPAAALSAETGLTLPNPARCLLEELAPLLDVAAAQAWARRLGPITRTEPRLARNARGQLGPVNPRHPAWAEIGLIDPTGRGIAHAQIRPGEPVPLGPGLLRITARNGSVMTGPGTNSYLLCSGDPADPASGWALIDPGPDDAVHVQALLAAAPGPIRWILVSHTTSTTPRPHRPSMPPPAPSAWVACRSIPSGRTTPSSPTASWPMATAWSSARRSPCRCCTPPATPATTCASTGWSRPCSSPATM
jgi:8-oxo-dGTP pyrophosphatase MutT (NUDIX family)